jgi:hypothetical protein
MGNDDRTYEIHPLADYILDMAGEQFAMSTGSSLGRA